MPLGAFLKSDNWSGPSLSPLRSAWTVSEIVRSSISKAFRLNIEIYSLNGSLFFYLILSMLITIFFAFYYL